MDRLLGLIAPHRCLNCGAEGALLCEACRHRAVSPRRPGCFLCNIPTVGWRTCKGCRRQTTVAGVVIASHYEGPVKELIRRLKYDRAVAAADTVAGLLASYIRAKQFDLLTAIPASSHRQRQRGYNQAMLIAKVLAHKLQLPLADVLIRQGHRRQVGTNRRQRLAQMAGTIRTKPAYRLASRPGKHHRLIDNRRILVIDDVVTTGATMSEAGRALKASGAKSVWGAAIAKH